MLRSSTTANMKLYPHSHAVPVSQNFNVDCSEKYLCADSGPAISAFQHSVVD